jgi:hypothetical protein
MSEKGADKRICAWTTNSKELPHHNRRAQSFARCSRSGNWICEPSQKRSVPQSHSANPSAGVPETQNCWSESEATAYQPCSGRTNHVVLELREHLGRELGGVRGRARCGSLMLRSSLVLGQDCPPSSQTDTTRTSREQIALGMHCYPATDPWEMLPKADPRRKRIPSG